MMSDNERMTPAEIIANRVGLGFSVKDLAAYMGVHHRTVYYWEAGRAKPPEWLAESFDDLWDITDEAIVDVATHLSRSTNGPIAITKPGESVIYGGADMPATWFCVVLGHIRLKYPKLEIRLKPEPASWPVD